MKVKLKKISSKIIQLHFDNQYNLAATFCRFQEYYESPVFKGKIFTLGQYRQWYCKEYGSWSYYSDWHGFNIPSYVLSPFILGLFDPLTEKEQFLIDKFKYRTNKFYIIGTCSDKLEALDHEICHGLFYVDEDYRKEMLVLIEHYKQKEPKAFKKIENFLAKAGYDSDVFNDEIQAYLASNAIYLEKKRGITPPKCYPEFVAVRDKYFKRHNIDTTDWLSNGL